MQAVVKTATELHWISVQHKSAPEGHGFRPRGSSLAIPSRTVVGGCIGLSNCGLVRKLAGLRCLEFFAERRDTKVNLLQLMLIPSATAGVVLLTCILVQRVRHEW